MCNCAHVGGCYVVWCAHTGVCCVVCACGCVLCGVVCERRRVMLCGVLLDLSSLVVVQVAV